VQARATPALGEFERELEIRRRERACALLRPFDQEQVSGFEEIPQTQLIHLPSSLESIQIDVHARERRGVPLEPISLHERIGGAADQAADAAGAQERAHARGLARAQIALEIQGGAALLGARECSGEGDTEGFGRGSVGEYEVEVGDCHAF